MLVQITVFLGWSLVSNVLLLVAVGHGFLSSSDQRGIKEKKLDILLVKIKLAPRSSVPLISRKQSNDNVILFMTPDSIQESLLFPL